MTESYKSDNRTCFVIMGFGRKMDYINSKEVDMDLLYTQVIKEVFQNDFPEYTLIRSDEVLDTQLIDVSMYALIMQADLVIADITTLNANALYELGIRHAERPFSTIIMMQKDEKDAIPFDLSRNHILLYEDYGLKLGKKKAERIKENLRQVIINSGDRVIDSTVHAVFPEQERPANIEREYQRIVQAYQQTKGEGSIRMLLNQAIELKNKSAFTEAVEKWKNLSEILPENDYIIQQMALAQYKSEQPTKEEALKAALKIIRKLNPDTSLDLETLGITGAIYKRLFKLRGKYEDLEKAIHYYQKGYIIQKDYYNGENYAYCLLEKRQEPGISEEEALCLKYLAMGTFQEIIERLEMLLEEELVDDSDYWMYATLSTCYYCTRDMDKYKSYRKKFYDKTSDTGFERKTYTEQLKNLETLLGG